jgi:alpha-1,2-mannosyltransferase
VFIDTTGWAFTYPLAWLAGSRVACYVHYPTVSMDMLDRVWSRQASYNNDDEIAGEGTAEQGCCRGRATSTLSAA